MTTLHVHLLAYYQPILPHSILDHSVGNVLKGCVLSYQVVECEKPSAREDSPSQSFPALPLNITPCVFNIRSEERHTQLIVMNMTLDEAHTLEQSTCIQSQSKWKESRVRWVTASRFGYMLLQKSPPRKSVINTFFDAASIQLFQLPLIMAFRMK